MSPAAVVTTLLVVAAVGCALVAGVFAGFSTIVVPGLRRLSAVEGAATMRAINAAAVRPAFMVLLFLLALLCAVLAVVGVLGLLGAGAPSEVRAGGATVVGALLYLVGTIGVTAGRNVPLNTALESLDAAGPGGAQAWASQRESWAGWNHVRAILALAASVALGASAWWGASGG